MSEAALIFLTTQPDYWRPILLQAFVGCSVLKFKTFEYHFLERYKSVQIESIAAKHVASVQFDDRNKCLRIKNAGNLLNEISEQINMLLNDNKCQIVLFDRDFPIDNFLSSTSQDFVQTLEKETSTIVQRAGHDDLEAGTCLRKLSLA